MNESFPLMLVLFALMSTVASYERSDAYRFDTELKKSFAVTIPCAKAEIERTAEKKAAQKNFFIKSSKIPFFILLKISPMVKDSVFAITEISFCENALIE